MTSRSRRRPWMPLVVSLVALGLLGAGGWFFATQYFNRDNPDGQGCTFTTADGTAKLSLEQAHNAAIISGIAAADPDLGERAALVGLATAMQESRLKNLDYGDRDSLGLFQQRPSQGWGTPEQVRDPWYATSAFYKHLVKVKKWRTGDVNDVAQKVQRSGVPDGYRKHVEKATTMASVLAGRNEGALSCNDHEGTGSDAPRLASELKKTYGVVATIDEKIMTVKAPTRAQAWSMASFAVASTREMGVVEVRLGDRMWALNGSEPKPWVQADKPTASETTVVITLR